jgi:hypothetical protein
VKKRHPTCGVVVGMIIDEWLVELQCDSPCDGTLCDNAGKAFSRVPVNHTRHAVSIREWAQKTRERNPAYRGCCRQLPHAGGPFAKYTPVPSPQKGPVGSLFTTGRETGGNETNGFQREAVLETGEQFEDPVPEMVIDVVCQQQHGGLLAHLIQCRISEGKGRSREYICKMPLP